MSKKKNTFYTEDIKLKAIEMKAEVIVVNEKKIYKTQTYDDFHKKNLDYDEWYDEFGNVLIGIEAKDIIGKVWFSIPLIGYVISFLQYLFKNPILLTLVFLNIIILTTLYFYIKDTKAKKNEDSNSKD